MPQLDPAAGGAPTPGGELDGTTPGVAKTLPKKKKRRWLRRLFFVGAAFVVLLLGAVVALPYALATRPGLSYALNLVNNRINGWVYAEGAAISWFSPIELRGVRIVDGDARDVLTVARITCTHSLAGAALGGLDFGEITIEAPHASLFYGADDEISLLQALQLRTPSTTESSGILPRPRGRIVVQSGKLLAARASGERVEIADINLDLRLDTLSTIKGELGLTFPDGVKAAGKIDVRDLISEEQFRLHRVIGSVNLNTDGDVQLAPLTAVFAPGAAVVGAARLNLSATTEGGAARGEFAVQLTKVQSAQTSGTLAPVDLALTGTLARDGQQLSAKTQFSGDAGQIDAELSYNTAAAESPAAGGDIADAILTGTAVQLPDFALTARGGIDLARLQRAMPGLVPVRAGRQLTSGRIDIAEVDVRGGTAATARASIALRDLAGTEGGRPIRIEPITLDVDTHVKPGVGLEIGKAELKSSFASVVASGNATNLKADFRASLAKLEQELGQLLDLSGLRLGGEIGGQVNIVRVGADRLNVDLTTTGDGVRLGTSGSSFNAQRLSARQTAAVTFPESGATRVETSGDVTATNLGVDGNPVLDGDTKLEWTNVTLGEAAVGIRADVLRLTSSAANVEAKVVQLQTGPVLSASADVQSDVDLARVSRAVARFSKMEKPPEIGGKLTLNTRIATNGAATTLSGRGGIDGLEIGSGTSAVREPRVDLEFDAGLDGTARRISLTRAAITSTPLTAEITGSIDQYDGPCNLALRGRYDASWEQLTRLLHELSPATTTTVLVAGKSVSQFEISGPLRSAGGASPLRGLSGGVDVGWSAADLYGVKLGAATLKPVLRDGKLTLPPTAIAVADGRANLAASVDFTAADPTLDLPGTTKLLENVGVTPLIGQSLLSHINPIFLHMTRVEGRVNLAVQDVHMPFGESMKHSGRGSGVLDLQSMKVQPSGLMGLLLELGGYAGDQIHPVQFGKLDFVIRDGRVIYDNFTMVIPNDFELRFRGSVGFDDTLDLIVSVPVREGLLQKLGLKGPALDAAKKLAGARVELPIMGTRERPQLDLKKVDVTKLLGEALVPTTPEKAAEGLLDILRKTQEAAPKKKP